MLILNDNDKNLINNLETVEFEFDDKDFCIKFEDGVWFCESNNPDIDEIIIIEDLQKEIKFDDESVEIFEGFIFTQDLFQQYKQILNLK